MKKLLSLCCKQKQIFMYPYELVKPMIEDLTRIGFEELKTPETVREALKEKEPLW